MWLKKQPRNGDFFLPNEFKQMKTAIWPSGGNMLHDDT